MTDLTNRLLGIIEDQQKLIVRLTNLLENDYSDNPQSIVKPNEFKPIKSRMGMKEVVHKLEELHRIPHPTEDYWKKQAAEEAAKLGVKSNEDAGANGGDEGYTTIREGNNREEELKEETL